MEPELAESSYRAPPGRHALAMALTLSAASFAGVGVAQATCSPASGQDNVTVTCSSNTTNQDGTNGYGQGIEDGVTVNVSNGVTVSGTDVGISLSIVRFHSTLNNSGTVTGGTDGFVGALNMVVNNSGTITGISDTAIRTNSVIVLVNSGTISGADLASSRLIPR
jgi:hypothetical protein